MPFAIRFVVIRGITFCCEYLFSLTKEAGWRIKDDTLDAVAAVIVIYRKIRSTCLVGYSSINFLFTGQFKILSKVEVISEPVSPSRSRNNRTEVYEALISDKKNAFENTASISEF